MPAALDFDPALPALPAAVRPAEAAALLAARGHEVGELRRQDVKYLPLTRCVTSWAVTLGEAGGRAERTVAAVVVTPEGASLRFPDEDEGLPGLAEALDARRMLARLAERVLAPGGQVLEPGGQVLAPGERVLGCAATPVRYKFGTRCTIRYDLRTHAGVRTLYGKLVAGGWGARPGILAALRRAASADPAMPEILPVVAHWPDLRLLVQPAAEQATELNQRAFDPAVPAAARDGWLAAAGCHLAALHACRLPGVALPAAGADLDELRACAAPMAQAAPELARRYESVIGLLDRRAGAEPPEPAVTSHGAFRTDQLLIAGQRQVMIDLDTACRSEPARDLGNLLAYLDWKAIRRPALLPLAERAGRVLLHAYADARPAPAESRLALQRATSLAKIAGRRYRSLTVEEWPLVPRLLDAATALAS